MIAAACLLAASLAPAAASAQSYYHPNSYTYYPGSYGYPAYDYYQYIPVMPYVSVYAPQTNYQPSYAYQQQQQQQSGGYSYPGSSYPLFYPQSAYRYGRYGYPSYGSMMYPEQGYFTGDYDAFQSPICYFPSYGRADCGSDPRQPVYDVWTGTWY